MLPQIDETHDAALSSWVDGADGHPDFPIQNLPHGVFATAGEAPRGGVAIGDWILDLSALTKAGLITGSVAEAAAGQNLNAFLEMGSDARRTLRLALSRMLRRGAAQTEATAGCLVPQAEAQMLVPCAIGDYTDFFAGINHAMNAGKQFRPDNPLLPNYKYVPIAYHGRASSIRPSGFEVRRPQGQSKSPDRDAPDFGPCRRLDYELEMGIWIGGSNPLGQPVPITEAAQAVAGLCLLNDWSARDIQVWEYQPLGPFLAKNFATSISPWIITAEALAPYRVAQPPRPTGDPAPLPYLADQADQQNGLFAINLSVWLETAAMRDAGLPPFRLGGASMTDLYWTPAQMVTHHTVGGCNLSSGDLLGTGTISGPNRENLGSLLEITFNGKEPIALPGGETRTFLEDGDRITFRASASAEGFATIGFGQCDGLIKG